MEGKYFIFLYTILMVQSHYPTTAKFDPNWVSHNVYNGVPKHAVKSGYDSDNNAIYVARAWHNGNLVPCHFNANNQKAYLTWNAEVIKKTDIEVLTTDYYTWQPGENGSVPPLSLKVGQTVDGEPLYIGRGLSEGKIIPGKLHPSYGCLFIPNGYNEKCLQSYEVLINPWVSGSSKRGILPGTVQAGHNINGDKLFVSRKKNGTVEFLVGNGYDWVYESYGNIPPNAVNTGITLKGELVYVGRGYYKGGLLPGQIHVSDKCLHIKVDDEDVCLNFYEALVRV